MSDGKVTSSQVAKRAGVSRSAVSRAFTPGASVSKRTAEKVRVAAHELGYRPNVLARSLITGRSRIVGVVVAYLENQFYPEALENLSRALQAEGYHALVFMASNTGAETEQVIEELLDYQVDAIIGASIGMSNTLTLRCAAAGIPIVLFNRTQDDDRLSSVSTNNRAGGRMVADLLIEGGHERIGYIAGWEGASTQRDREAGFTEGLAKAGRRISDRAVGNFDLETTRAATRDMFKSITPPDAVFVANDHMAFAVMDVLRFELGLAIPDDVSVVGYDDTALAAWPSYNLTTIRQPAQQMTSETVRVVMERIDRSDAPPRQIQLPGRMILRGSARIPEGWIHEGL
ncbi:MAG: LacI family DNA-binding transcriptional regulator [Pseudomonadota bacterium]